MIIFSNARHKIFYVPVRTEATPLDRERSFLMRIVGRTIKKVALRESETSRRFPQDDGGPNERLRKTPH